jgi:hypothetical protein
MGAQGTATLDFGAFPGTSEATVAVTGQASIVGGSLVEAWIFPTATADHSEDEHRAEDLVVSVGALVVGTGFTIYGRGGATPANGICTTVYGAWTVGWVWN